MDYYTVVKNSYFSLLTLFLNPFTRWIAVHLVSRLNSCIPMPLLSTQPSRGVRYHGLSTYMFKHVAQTNNASRSTDPYTHGNHTCKCRLRSIILFQFIYSIIWHMTSTILQRYNITVTVCDCNFYRNDIVYFIKYPKNHVLWNDIAVSCLL